jgi:hypothetical protein
VKVNKASILRRLRRDTKLIDAHTHVGTAPVGYVRGDSPYALSGEDMVLRLKARKIDAAVCFPMMYTTYFRFNAFRTGRFVRDPNGASAFPYEALQRRIGHTNTLRFLCGGE